MNKKKGIDSEKNDSPSWDKKDKVYRCPHCYGEGVIGEEWHFCLYCDGLGAVHREDLDRYSDWLAIYN